ncbi:Paired amphipathic helix protein Sin3-like 1 [Carex littledalei]|uniref:Paired amphipathic helix protein Sin3-like 1 n=1 Tax=Carex littledalei TaxID=544730 RepID=A0A833R3T2_9POAL|nr:Paired amphipathic helix protein Sin3-like 1 [Carex littledalei]
MANNPGNPVANVGGHAESTSSSVNQRRWPDDVVSFLNLVKKKFENEPEIYRQFFRMMADYKKFRTSAKCLIIEVYVLFKEHEELLEGFNQFLPREYRSCEDFDFEDAIAFVTKIKVRKLFEEHPDLILEYRKYLPPVMPVNASRRLCWGVIRSVQSQPTDMPALGSAAASRSTQIEDALNYLLKLKERFKDHLDTYEEFLSILKDFKNRRTDVDMTIAEVRDLLQGNHDLILGFNIFLPEERRMDKKTLVEYDRATDIINIIKSRLRRELNQIMPFLEVLDGFNVNAMTFEDFYKEVMVSLENHPDLLDELRVPILMAYLSVKPHQ